MKLKIRLYSYNLFFLNIEVSVSKISRKYFKYFLFNIIGINLTSLNLLKNVIILLINNSFVNS